MMSQAAMAHFINEIMRVHGPDARDNIGASLSAHVNYYEGHYRKSSPLRALMEQFLSASDTLRIETAQAAGIEKAQSDGKAARLKRLRDAPRKPIAVETKARVFLRNYDVIVEVLERAAGICEECGSSAPFNRRTNDEPYLEVHHKIRLSDDGEDTVENAVALCPNCHRRMHYGPAI